MKVLILGLLHQYHHHVKEEKEGYLVELSSKLGAGRKSSLPSELISDLKTFFENICVEYFFCFAAFDACTRKVAVSSSNFERGTHKTHKRHNVEVENDYHDNIKMKIRLLAVDCSNFYNMNEANMYFSPQPTSTYAPTGS
jgi:hypothetical protein